jgi:hypothetical protein
MKAAVALALSVSLLGCFPNNARHRTYAKYAEGASLVTGIIISAVANTGADCDQMSMAGVDDNCRTTAKWLSTAGVILILTGLVGFVATIATAEDDSESTPRVLSREPTQGSAAGSGSAAPTTGTGSAAPTDGAGSAAPSTDAPPTVPAPNEVVPPSFR